MLDTIAHINALSDEYGITEVDVTTVLARDRALT